MKNPSGSETGSVALLPTLRSRVGAFFGSVTAAERRKCVAARRETAGAPEVLTGLISYFALIAARRASNGSIALMAGLEWVEWRNGLCKMVPKQTHINNP